MRTRLVSTVGAGLMLASAAVAVSGQTAQKAAAAMVVYKSAT